MHVISSYRGNRPTNTHTHPPTNRQDRLQYTAQQLARSVMRQERKNGTKGTKEMHNSASPIILKRLYGLIAK